MGIVVARNARSGVDIGGVMFWNNDGIV